MRVLHFDINAEISGDMTIAALAHLGTTLEPLQDALQALTQLRLKIQEVRPSGILANRYKVKNIQEEHHHRTLEGIFDLLEKTGLPTGALR